MVIKNMLGRSVCTGMSEFIMHITQGGETDERGIFNWTYNCVFWH